jgi:hypothetical protein
MIFFSFSGRQILNSLSPNESMTPAAQSILDLLQLPKIVKNLLSFFTSSTDPMASQLYGIMHQKTTVQDRQSIIARDLYREEWHKKWTDEGLDFVLMVPHPFPAVENGTSEQVTLMSAGYTLLFNLVSFFFYPFSLSHNNNNIEIIIIARLHCWCTPHHVCRQITRRSSERFYSF